MLWILTLIHYIISHCRLSVRLLTDCHIRLSQVFEGSTIFVTVSVASALEMPAGMLAFFSADKLGRKMTIVVGFAMLFIGEGVLALTYSGTATKIFLTS